jgi:hypothetical protein
MTLRRINMWLKPPVWWIYAIDWETGEGRVNGLTCNKCFGVSVPPSPPCSKPWGECGLQIKSAPTPCRFALHRKIHTSNVMPSGQMSWKTLPFSVKAEMWGLIKPGRFSPCEELVLKHKGESHWLIHLKVWICIQGPTISTMMCDLSL